MNFRARSAFTVSGPVRTNDPFLARFRNLLKSLYIWSFNTEQIYGIYKLLKLKTSFCVP